ncbi:MAG TPA: DUF3052 domain-containing protein [Acidimicrobiia bacterium]|jgi:hypothetical protein
MAGYSGTPLSEKLGIKEDMTVGILNPPDHFDLDELAEGVETHENEQPADLYLIFADRADDAERDFRVAMAMMPPDGSIWIAWPKKSSGVETDITENTLRELFLPTGMVDNKVCAIDETWSGLRFVVRKENRAGWPPS